MKAKLIVATGIDTSTMASKTDLTILNTKVNNLDVDKCKTVTPDLSKLCNVVDNQIVKKIVHHNLVIKVSAIDTKIPHTSGSVTKTKYNSVKQSLEKKIEDID